MRETVGRWSDIDRIFIDVGKWAPNTDLQRLIIANASRDELTEYLGSHDVKLLFDDGIDRVLEGATTIEEIWRVVNS